MHLRLRYGLIIAGFIVFLVLAPLFVLFVSGQRFDINSRQFSHTGVLSVATKPAGATVTVNDADPKKTPVNVRFLLPGNYAVRITKPGYFPWQKQLDVRADRVTYAHVSDDAVSLLKDTPAQPLVSGVSLYTVSRDSIFWTAGPDFNRTSLKDTTQTQTTTLAFTPTSLLSSPNNQWLLVSDSNHASLWSAAENTFTSLSTLVTSPVVSDEGAVLGLVGAANEPQTLVWLHDRSAPVTVAQNVLSFTLAGQNLYYLQASTTGANLITQTIAENGQVSQPQMLGTNSTLTLPSYLFVTDTKAVFAHSGNKLWLMGQAPQLLADNVSSVSLMSNDSILYRTGLEWRVRNANDGSDTLVTRSGSTDLVTLNSALPYAFVWSTQGLYAQELDNRDTPNRYTLSDQAVSAVTVNRDADTLYYLVGSQLFSRSIR